MDTTDIILIITAFGTIISTIIMIIHCISKTNKNVLIIEVIQKIIKMTVFVKIIEN